MLSNARTGRSCPKRRTRRVLMRKRAVASVLAMMFLVIFGSLTAVMGVVAQGNLRTAEAHLHVTRARSSAEAGLIYATWQLRQAARRFVVEKGTIDEAFADKLWMGGFESGDGQVIVLDPVGYDEDVPAESLVDAIVNATLAADHNLVVEAGDELLPSVDEFGKIVAPPVATSSATGAPYFRLVYEPDVTGTQIRVTCTGHAGDVTRTVRMTFLITKRLDAAIISPSRVMIGKNVHIDGPIGSLYGEELEQLEADNGHPIVLRSDFRYLDSTLDARIDALISSIAAYDVDGDNRLRPAHPGEAEGLTEAYMVDHNGDGFVDDYDLFLGIFDDNADARIAWNEELMTLAGINGLSVEFSGIDDQLAELIDTINPDRNGDGVVDEADVILGYSDGVIDNLDGYSKVQGHLMFKASRSEWESAQGGISIHDILNGPIYRTSPDQAPMEFEVDDSKLYDLTSADFTNSQNALKQAALDGLAFWSQVSSQLGTDPNSHVWSDHATDPDYLRQDLGPWEQMPLGSPGFYDWYQRPIFKNMTFVNVMIPMGLNALFDDCTFIGSVYVEACPENEHHNWNFLGMKEYIGGVYVDKFDYQHWEPMLYVPEPWNPTPDEPVLDTRPFSNNVRFHDCTVIGSVVADALNEFTHVRNKIQFTGNTRFTLDPDEIGGTNLPEEEQDQAENTFNENLTELSKSSLMAPGFSVDVGNFENSGETVELKGTIVAGVMDIRGNADILGTLLMTYRPIDGQGALYYGGSEASFNTTIGYFGPDDGDGEGEEPDLETGFGQITITYDPDLPLPDGILAPIKIVFLPGSYSEGL